MRDLNPPTDFAHDIWAAGSSLLLYYCGFNVNDLPEAAIREFADKGLTNKIIHMIPDLPYGR